MAGTDVPDWARAALPTLPELMRSSDRRAKAVERACTDAVEAAVLAPRLGETFTASVVDLSDKGPSLVQLVDLPVLAPCAGDDLELGSTLEVRLVEA